MKAEKALGFLARTLTKVESKPKPILKAPLRHRPDLSEDDEDDLEDDATLPIPVFMHESNDPHLRSQVDHILSSKLRADSRTYAQVLRECGKKRALLEGKQIHSHICLGGIEPSHFHCNLLMQMYGNCGSVLEAKAIFDKMPIRSVYSWTIMISALAQNGYIQDASVLFETIESPNVVTWNAMVSGYAQNGYLLEARELFERLPQKDVASWNAIIGANAHAGYFATSLGLFRRMDIDGVRPNKITFLHALNACSRAEEGLVLHMSIVESNIETSVAIATGLVMMYGKCGLPEEALKVFEDTKGLDLILWTSFIVAQAQNGLMENARLIFEKMPGSNVVTWTAMLAGYAQSGQGKHAWELFKKMDLEGVTPNKITFISVLEACNDLQNGKITHSNIMDAGLGQETMVCNALIGMYGKCKNLESAQLVFSEMGRRNVVSWSSLLSSYAQNGFDLAALEVFREMQLEGVRPNEVTLLSVLSACSHAGFVAQGVEYFVTVPFDYHGINLAVEHFTVFTDMLTRWSKLKGRRVYKERMFLTI